MGVSVGVPLAAADDHILGIDSLQKVLRVGGTAAVVGGQDDEARTHYERALRLEPKNKIAVRNLKVLAE